MLTVTKTDEIDARLIAMYGGRCDPHLTNSATILSLSSGRSALYCVSSKRQFVATRNLRGSMEVLPHFDPECRKTIERTIIFLEKQIKAMEEKLASLAQGEYKKQMDLLTSVKGIGVTLATVLIVATGGFACFDNVRQLSDVIPNARHVSTVLSLTASLARWWSLHRQQTRKASLRCRLPRKTYADGFKSEKS